MEGGFVGHNERAGELQDVESMFRVVRCGIFLCGVTLSVVRSVKSLLPMNEGPEGKSPRKRFGHKAAFLAIKSWSKRMHRRSCSRSDSASRWDSADSYQKADERSTEAESLSSECFEDDVVPGKPSKECEKKFGRRQWIILTLAAVIFVAGHWHHIVDLLLSVSGSSLSSAAAAACVAAALWPAAALQWKSCTSIAISLAWQAWSVVDSLILAIFKLPECSRDIKLAVQEIREVCNTLKSIKAKIAFLPGDFRPPPVDGLDHENGLMAELSSQR